MTATRSVTLDETLIQSARKADPAEAGRSDDEVIERALTRYLAIRAMDRAQGLSTLDEDEGLGLANAELHAARAERRQRQ